MKKSIILLFMILALQVTSWAKIIYVNVNYTGGIKDGTSWLTPYTDLTEAVQSSAPGDELWFAAGTYNSSIPSDTITDIVHSLSIYGGFSGTESNIYERDLEVNETVFIAEQEGTERLMFLLDLNNEEFLLDGVTLTGCTGGFNGSTIGSHYTFENVAFSGITANSPIGGFHPNGVFEIDNCFFDDCYESSFISEKVSFTNCTFENYNTGQIFSCDLDELRMINIKVSNCNGRLNPYDINKGYFENLDISDNLYNSPILSIGAVEELIIKNSTFRNNASGGLESYRNTNKVEFDNLLFEGNGTINSDFGQYINGKEISIRNSVFNNNNAGYLLNLSSSGDLLEIDDCEFKNNVLTFNLINCNAKKQFVLNKINIEGNQSSGSHLLSLPSNDTVFILSSTIINNSCEDGNLIYRLGNDEDYTKIENTKISSNELSTSFSNGRPLYNGERLEIKNSEISQNDVRIYLLQIQSSSSNPSFIIDSKIESNFSTYGGLLSSEGGSSHKIHIKRSKIRDNTANGSQFIYAVGGVLIENSLFIDNRLDYNVPFISGTCSSSSIISCTFYKNIFPFSTFYSKAHFSCPNMNIFNTILWDNEFREYQGIAVSYSNSNTTFNGTGNTNLDPKFEDAENGDFRLSCESPLLDAGSNLYIPEGTDFAGHERLRGARVDMGALEFEGDPAQLAILPDLSFSVDNDNPCRTETVKFTSTTPYAEVYKYSWDFGDQSLLSTAQNPEHIYTTPGQYTVSMTATNSCGKSATISQNVLVKDAFVPTITGQSVVCPGDSLVLRTDASCGDLNWTIDGGIIWSGQGENEVVVEWDQQRKANGSVTLLATSCGDDASCEFPITIYIPIVQSKPVVLGEDTVCATQENSYVLETRKLVAGNYFTWSVEGGQFLSASEGYNLDSVRVEWDEGITDGKIKVVSSHELLDCEGADSILVKATSLYTINEEANLCGNTTTAFSTDLPGSFNWTIEGDENTINPTTGEVQWGNVPGSYLITATPTDPTAFCNASSEFLAELNRTPTIDTILGEVLVDTISVYPYEVIHDGEEGSINWSFTGATYRDNIDQNIRGYEWDRNEPFSLTATYSINGCSSDPFVLDIEKDLIFLIDGPDEACVGSSPTFSSSNSLPGLTYTWVLNQDTLSATANSITPELTLPGVNVLRMIATNGERTYRAEKFFDVNALDADLEIIGASFVAPGGGGSEVYHIDNPSDLTLNIDVIGATAFNITEDTVVSVDWGTGGTYEVNVFGTQTGQPCPTAKTVLEVNEAEVFSPAITLSGGTSCLNDEANYTFNSDEFTENVVWSLNDGGTILSQDKNSATVEWSAEPGNYSLSVRYNRFGISQTTEIVEVFTPPTPQINDATICGDESTPLSTIQSYAGYSWSLEPDPTVISTAASPNVTESGYYKVTVTDVNGCRGSTSKFIKYVPIPQAKIFAEGDISLCPNQTGGDVVLSTFNGDSYSYQWFEDGNPIASGTNSEITVSHEQSSPVSRVYTVRVTSDICENISSGTALRVLDDCSTSGGGGCTEQVSFEVSGCQPFKITNTSSQSSGFTWNFDDGRQSISPNPQPITYNEIGVYTITLRNGCARASKQVEVPVVAVYTQPDVACLNEEITLEDYSAWLKGSQIDSWEWTFGDGDTQSGTGPLRTTTHSFDTVDEFKTSLTVSGVNSDGETCAHTFTYPINQNQDNIEILPLPNVSFTIEEPDCDDDLFTFDNTSNQNTQEASYVWDLDDGKTSTAESPSVKYTSFGAKTALLTVTDFTTCSNTADQDFVANAPVAIQEIVTTDNLDLCDEETATLTAPLSDAGYIWKRNGVVEPGFTTRSIEVSESGSYTVEYSTTGCVLETEEVNVNVFTPASTVVPQGPVCEGSSVRLRIDPYINNRYSAEWRKGGAILPSVSRDLVLSDLSSADDGAYSVTITNTANGCKFALPDYNMTVASYPEVPVLSASNDEVCYDSSNVISYTNPVADISRVWYLNGGDFAQETDQFTVDNPTNDYSVRLEITDNSSGCVSRSLNTNVQVAPQRNLSLTSPDTICENDLFLIRSTITGDGFDYEWYKDGALTTFEEAEYQVASTTLGEIASYHVIAESNGNNNIAGCIFNSDTVSVYVLEGPDEPEITGTLTYCEGTNTQLSTNLTDNFVWSTGETTSSITVFQPANYNVTVTDPITGCTQRSTVTVTENPLPVLDFLGTGYYERCANEPLSIQGLNDFPRYQWKYNGVALGEPNETIYPRRSGKYTVEVETDEGCIDESDTLFITSLPCACEVVTVEDNIAVGSLRDAITCANTKPGIDLIIFKLPGEGPHVFEIDSALPVITEGAILDGFTQTGEGVYDIIIEPGLYNEFAFQYGFGTDGSELRGLTINDFEIGALWGTNTENAVLEQNFWNNNDFAAVFESGGANVTIRNNTFTGAGATGMLLRKNHNFTITQNNFKTLKQGIRISSSTNAQIELNAFQDLEEAGVILGGESQSNTLSENLFFNIDQSGVIARNNVQDNDFTANTFGRDSLNAPAPLGKYGLQFEGSTANTVRENIFENAIHGIYLSNTSGNILEANTMLELDSAGIYTINSTNDSIMMNQLTGGLFGIHMEASTANYTYGNMATASQEAGIYMHEGSDHHLVADTITQSVGPGILVDESFNNIVEEAVLFENTANGSAVLIGTGNAISRSIHYGNGEPELSLNLGTADEANNGMNTPSVDGAIIYGNEVVYNGVTTNAALVEAFLNDGSQQVEAIAFAGDSLAEASGNWKLAYDISSLSPGDSLMMVFTATDNGNNTSQFSAIRVACPTCECEVTTNADDGEGTLREAVTKANEALCGSIAFDLSPGSDADTIKLLSPLPELNSSILIDGTTEPGYTAESTPPVVIKNGGAITQDGLVLNGPSSNIKGLTFDGFDQALVVNASGTSLEDNTIINVLGSAVVMNGDDNTLTGNSINVTPEGEHLYAQADSALVVINGDNNVVGTENSPNDILNGVSTGISVIGGTGNSLTYNSINNVASPYSASAFTAIRLASGTNEDIDKPEIDDAEVNNGVLTISGNGPENSTIQIFLNNGQVQQALDFVVEVESDGAGEWSVTIPSAYYDETTNNFFVATATNSNISTSAVSTNFLAGDDPIVCPVENTLDEGKGSYREAIACVNNAYTAFNRGAIVAFELPASPNEINLLSATAEIENPLGVTIDPLDVPVKIAGDGSFFGIQWTTPQNQVAINNLELDNFSVAINGTGSNITINQNKITNSETGISLNSTGFGVIASENEIFNASVGVALEGNNVQVIDNTLGIDVDNDLSAPITGYGIYTIDGSSITIDGNIIGEVQVSADLTDPFDSPANGSAIYLDGDAPSATIQNNTLGFDNGTDTLGAAASAIYVFGGSNGVADNNLRTSDKVQLVENTILYANNGITLDQVDSANVSANDILQAEVYGIVVDKGIYNLLTENLIHDFEDVAGQGIAHLNSGNEDYPVPTQERYTVYNGFLEVHGLSNPEDIIEIFQGAPGGQRAVEYLARDVANEDGRWRVDVPLDRIELNGTNYFVATATDTAGNTSELSTNLDVFFSSCIVTNTNNEGTESFRDAILGANAGQCNLVLFDISPGVSTPDTITITEALPEVVVDDLVIDASSESGYTPDGGPVVNVKYDGADLVTGLSVSGVSNFSVHGLNFVEMENGIAISNAEVSEVSHNGCYKLEGTGISITGPAAYNLIFQNKVGYSIGDTVDFDGAAIGFHIDAEGTLADTNFAYHNTEKGFWITADYVSSSYNTAQSNDSVEVYGAGKGGFVVEGAKGVMLRQNGTRNNSTGIEVIDSDSILIYNNFVGTGSFPNRAFGIHVSEGKHHQVNDNFLFDQKGVGIQLEQISDISYVRKNFILNNVGPALSLIDVREIEVDSNEFLLSKTNAIVLGNNARANTLSNNSIINGDSAGVVILATADSNRVYANSIGIDNLAGASVKVDTNSINDPYSEADPNQGAGIIIESDHNWIGEVGLGNTIQFNYGGGVWVRSGIGNRIAYNNIAFNDTSRLIPTTKAIDLNGGAGNNNKTAPVVDAFTRASGEITVTGTAPVGNTIHLYLNNGFTQNARKYLGEATAGGGNWSIAFSDTLLEKNQGNYVVATATNNNDNTSELSNMIPVGDCFVTVDDDNGNEEYPIIGSLRMGYACLNSQTNPAKLLFTIPRSDLQLDIIAPLSDLYNPGGVTIEGKNFGKDVMTIAADSLGTAVDSALVLNPALGPSSINDLSFVNYPYGAHLLSDQAALNNVDVNTDTTLLDGAAVTVHSGTFGNIVANGYYAGYREGIWIQPGAENDTIQGNTVTRADVGIQLSNINNALVSGNNLTGLAKEGIRVDDINSASVVISGNRIGGSDTVVYTGIRLNQTDNLFVLSNTISNVSKNTSSTDSIQAHGILVENSGTGLSISGNNISNIEGNGITFLHECDGCPTDAVDTRFNNNTLRQNAIRVNNGYGMALSGSDYIVRENSINTGTGGNPFFIRELSSANIDSNNISTPTGYGIELSASDNIRMSQNIITQFDTLKKGINLNFDLAIESNNRKEAPFIDTHSIENEDCKTLFLLKGTSDPGDRIEVFESDTLLATTRVFIGDTIADANGDWEFEVLSEYFKYPDEGNYFFTATATDIAEERTSEVSNILFVENIVEEFVVTNTDDEGQGSLREAIESINCTDFYSIVYFKIQESGPYVITLDSLLPMVENPMGFELNAITQIDSGYGEGLDQRIYVDGVNLSSGHGLAILDSCGPALVNALHWINFDSALVINNGGNTLSNMMIINEAGDGATGIVLANDSSSNVKVNNNLVSGYEEGVVVGSGLNKLELKENHVFGGRVGVRIKKGLTESIIQDNVVGETDSVAIYLKEPTADVDALNIFTGNTIGIDTSGTPRPIKGIGILLDNVNQHRVDYNTVVNLSQSTFHSEPPVAIKLQARGENNFIANNTIGADTAGVAGPIEGHGILMTSGLDSLGNLTNPLNNFISANSISYVSGTAITIENGRRNSVLDNHVGITLAGDTVPGAAIALEVLQDTAANVTNNSFINYSSQGMVLEGARQVRLSRNAVYSGTSTAIGIDINLNDAAKLSNDSIAAPQSLEFEYQTPNLIEVAGKGMPGERIELFVGYEGLYQATRYIGQATVLPDSSWNMDVGSAFMDFGDEQYYVATATDASGNTSQLSDALPVSGLLCLVTDDLLPDTTKFCPGTEARLNPGLSGMTYSWTGPDDSYNTQIVDTDVPGDYSLTISDNFGCTYNDQIHAFRYSQAVEPDFLLTSKAFVEDTVAVVLIGEVLPDSVEWTWSGATAWQPDSINNPRLYHVKFPSTGEFTIIQKSVSGVCASYLSKTIEVFDPVDVDGGLFDDLNIDVTVSELLAYPNPNQGVYSVDVVLNKVADVWLSVIKVDGGAVYEQRLLTGQEEYTEVFDTGNLTQGVYVIRTQIGSITKTFTMEVLL